MGVNYFRRDGRDSKFVLLEHLDVERLLSYPPYQDFSADDFAMIIDEALKVGREVLGPALQDGDRMGCAYENGTVRTPGAFKECWRVFNENGWPAATYNPEFGGQGLPEVVGGLVGEIFNGANMAMMTYSGLMVGNGHLIESFGTDQDRDMFLENMYTGVWGGTMCLTEPDAGSDVGALRTKAVPDPDSGDPRIYKIEGVKRFITCGEHDLTENIIHLVLARIEGGPAGTKGVSLFIVPKIWVNPDGSPGQSNDVFCAGIEHKMGIHGSSTCTLNFGEQGKCRGILLGEPHSGMAKMFQMMNHARIGCGIQAAGATASAYDTARIYAKERVQGAPLTDRHGQAVPIIQHEDVRRMLMGLKAGSEAMRVFVAYLMFNSDVAKHDPDEVTRQKARDRVDILTPLVKAYPPDLGYMLIRDAIQVLAGAGYCSDFPVEQYARDMKILSIWEGTNYIQALDLVGRKIGYQGGKVFQEWVAELMAFAKENEADQDFQADFKLLGQTVGMVGDFAQRFAGYFKQGRISLVPMYATRFLECFAETVLAKLMLEQGLIARQKLAGVEPGSGDYAFYQGKMASAKFFCRNILTNVFGRYAALKTEDLSAVEIPEEAF
ncbi:MAG: acyl-CoA dehydrogenase [Proteobacteria bacterium]|nr:acyl-CoA dehydrogenase [Pseudomonadota bacterium]MBU1449396.1 acyl-CoA dehydrogenase [Pseudomonadota bacterium]MBU2470538.1 acyl-CoA dehydrogenase [Pseudomonadota bacterium]MBU2519578.1 acyl-CoA dehydrogenase [Pseudomonadota bacterium]